MNNVLAKEKALACARNGHTLPVRDYSDFNPVVKGVISATSVNPTHSNHNFSSKTYE